MSNVRTTIVTDEITPGYWRVTLPSAIGHHARIVDL